MIGTFNIRSNCRNDVVTMCVPMYIYTHTNHVVVNTRYVNTVIYQIVFMCTDGIKCLLSTEKTALSVEATVVQTFKFPIESER
jgi:hypothetical protein